MKNSGLAFPFDRAYNVPLRLRNIRTASGPKLTLGSFNVLVGPNNCGKSQTLRDIRDYVATGSLSRLTILKEIELDLPGEAEATQGLRILPHSSPGHVRYLGVTYDLQNRQEVAPQENWLTDQFKRRNEAGILGEILRNLGKFWVGHLDAESRLRLASPTECYDIRTETPSNALQSFFAGGIPALDELRRAFREAFDIGHSTRLGGHEAVVLKGGFQLRDDSG